VRDSLPAAKHKPRIFRHYRERQDGSARKFDASLTHSFIHSFSSLFGSDYPVPFDSILRHPYLSSCTITVLICDAIVFFVIVYFLISALPMYSVLMHITSQSVWKAKPISICNCCIITEHEVDF